mmetsp:Transcript_19152/g.37841  ORF Transcript_19152/g.37841 Transcript_19152/m.37841 type:complete len:119 (+) Transcript_19152:172-528(+)
MTSMRARSHRKRLRSGRRRRRRRPCFAPEEQLATSPNQIDVLNAAGKLITDGLDRVWCGIGHTGKSSADGVGRWAIQLDTLGFLWNPLLRFCSKSVFNLNSNTFVLESGSRKILLQDC